MKIARNLSSENKIEYCSSIIAIGFACIIVFYYINGFVNGLSYPRNTFLTQPIPFGDYLAIYEQWRQFKFNGIGFGLSYFPSTYLLMHPFTLIGNSKISVLIYSLVFYVPFLLLVYNNIKSNDSLIISARRLITFSVMCYPAIFSFHTGNIEIAIFMLIALFFWLYFNDYQKLSIFPLAFAISMKIIPIVFIVFLITERKFKLTFYTLSMVIIFTLIPLIIFDGGFNGGINNYISNLSQSQQLYYNLMVISPAGTHFGHSLLNSFFILFPDLIGYKEALFPYFIIVAIIFLLISSFLFLVKIEIWKKIALLSFADCLLPYTSTDYKLIIILIPLFLFFQSNDKKSKFDLLYVFAFSLLLIPKNYFYFNNSPLQSFNNVANTFLMIFISLIIVYTSLRNSKHFQSNLT